MTLPTGRVLGTHRGEHASGYGIADIDRPQPRPALDADDLAAWAEYERTNAEARRHYERHMRYLDYLETRKKK